MTSPHDSPYHKLLARQVRKIFDETDLREPKLLAFLDLVNDTYQDFEEEHTLLERSMEISSQELEGTLQTLRQQKQELTDAYANLRDTQHLLAESERVAQVRKEMQAVIERKNEELMASEEELRQNLEEMQTMQDKLLDQKQYLENTLTALQNTQQQLVQSEKMAALGQLVANIAHEINTPLGAIGSSVQSMSHILTRVTPDILAYLPTLEPDERRLFERCVVNMRQDGHKLSSKEQRQLKRVLCDELRTHEVVDADHVAEILVEMHLHQDLPLYLPLIRNPEVLRLLHRLFVVQQCTQTIHIATQKASKIIFALKNFSHHTHNGEMVSTSLQDTLETVLTIYHNHLKRGVEVIREFEEIPPIMCCPDELMQVWTNIFHNAIQAMDNQGTLCIKTRLQTNNIALVSIGDTGAGIPDAVKDKIFQAFFTTKQRGEGSGLGLDIVRKIVEKHQGKVYFESQEGKGTTFFVELPLLQA